MEEKEIFKKYYIRKVAFILDLIDLEKSLKTIEDNELYKNFGYTTIDEMIYNELGFHSFDDILDHCGKFEGFNDMCTRGCTKIKR